MADEMADETPDKDDLDGGAGEGDGVLSEEKDDDQELI